MQRSNFNGSVSYPFGLKPQGTAKRFWCQTEDEMSRKWTNTFLVGLYRCEMTYTERGGIRAKWSPNLPDRQLSNQEADQYRAGRDALFAEVGKSLGGSVVVVET